MEKVKKTVVIEIEQANFTKIKIMADHLKLPPAEVIQRILESVLNSGTWELKEVEAATGAS